MNPSILEQLQIDILGRLLSDPQLATVNILAEIKGVRTEDLNQTLVANTSLRAGSIKGVAIIVTMPSRRVPDKATPGPRVAADVMVRCIERPLINRGAGGNGLTAEFLSMRVEMLLHNYLLKDIPCTLVSDGADPVTYENLDREYANHVMSSIGLSPLRKVAIPLIGGTTEAVSIASTSNFDDVTLTYTTDGSFPYPANPTAQIYAAPFAVASGTIVRAIASVSNPTPNQAASDLASQLFE